MKFLAVLIFYTGFLALAGPPPPEAEIARFNAWLSSPSNQAWPVKGAKDSEDRYWHDWVWAHGGPTAIYRCCVRDANRDLVLVLLEVDAKSAAYEWLLANKRWPPQPSADGAHQSKEQLGIEAFTERKIFFAIHRLKGRKVFYESLSETRKKSLAFLVDEITVGNRNSDRAMKRRYQPMEDQAAELNAWILDPAHHTYPLTASKNAIERAWGQWIARHDGIEAVYNTWLTPEVRDLPLIQIRVEPLKAIGKWIALNHRWPKLDAAKSYQAGGGEIPLAAHIERRFANWIGTHGGKKKIAQALGDSTIPLPEGCDISLFVRLLDIE